MSSVLKISFLPDGCVEVVIGPWLWGSIILIAVVALIIKSRHWRWSRSLEIDEAEIGVGNAKLILKPNLADTAIAYRIWVEVSTRKIGLPIDFEKDVIADIYTSWYEFFRVTRELIKDVPPSKLRRKDTKQLIQLAVAILNEGVRPHLTSWHSQFRRWYRLAEDAAENKNLSAHEIQAKFPQYALLKSDMEAVNKRLMKYRETMHKLVFGE